MTTNEIHKAAKSLNDIELQILISKLQSLLDKRIHKAELKAKAIQEKQEKAQKTIEEIERAVIASGLSLKKLGLVSPCTFQTVEQVGHKKCRQYIHNANNLYYAIVDDHSVELVFGRKIGRYKQQGKALRFSDLNANQQKHAMQLVAFKNAKAS